MIRILLLHRWKAKHGRCKGCCWRAKLGSTNALPKYFAFLLNPGLLTVDTNRKSHRIPDPVEERSLMGTAFELICSIGLPTRRKQIRANLQLKGTLQHNCEWEFVSVYRRRVTASAIGERKFEEPGRCIDLWQFVCEVDGIYMDDSSRLELRFWRRCIKHKNHSWVALWITKPSGVGLTHVSKDWIKKNIVICGLNTVSVVLERLALQDKRFSSGLLTFGLATWKELDICGQAIKGIWGMSWH